MDWRRLKRFLQLRREAVPASRSFTVEAEWHRAEELRPELIGVPSEDEIRLGLPHDPWRPSKTLGKLPSSQ